MGDEKARLTDADDKSTGDESDPAENTRLLKLDK